MSPEIIAAISALASAIVALWLRLEAANRRSAKKHDECEQDRKSLNQQQAKLTRIVVAARFCRARDCKIREIAKAHEAHENAA